MSPGRRRAGGPETMVIAAVGPGPCTRCERSVSTFQRESPGSWFLLHGIETITNGGTISLSPVRTPPHPASDTGTASGPEEPPMSPPSWLAPAATRLRTGRADRRHLPGHRRDADHTTWSGIMVISERYKETRTESSTVGLGDEYDISDVPHAQRLITSGTFIHGTYWASTSVFGSENTSHGCIGLHDAKGADDKSVDGFKFCDSSMLGDVVVVTNSGKETVYPANGLGGWNLSRAEWQAGQARSAFTG
ncbi:L,D-transpeptidase [Streptomyces sp. PSKA01]|uniref:L,D-transpeptidase n=1 Tax=Streptomyces cupreus TaxID=2759956 RepID=A0A7X1IYN6_9ACTN|nr:L,D-transpeptidase [Streptomyces cupreus]